MCVFICLYQIIIWIHSQPIPGDAQWTAQFFIHTHSSLVFDAFASSNSSRGPRSLLDLIAHHKSSVVWIFYLLILNSFEKKSYITKFPDISPEIRKIKPTKIKHMKHTGKQFLLSSVYLIVSMLSCILSMFLLISSLFSACSHSHRSHFILCLHIISSHEAAASSASTPHKQWNFGRDWKESCVHMSKLFETNPSFQWMK